VTVSPFYCTGYYHDNFAVFLEFHTLNFYILNVQGFQGAKIQHY